MQVDLEIFVIEKSENGPKTLVLAIFELLLAFGDFTSVKPTIKGNSTDLKRDKFSTVLLKFFMLLTSPSEVSPIMLMSSAIVSKTT